MKSGKKVLLVFLVILLLLAAVILVFVFTSGGKDSSPEQFLESLYNNEINEVNVSSDTWTYSQTDKDNNNKKIAYSFYWRDGGMQYLEDYATGVKLAKNLIVENGTLVTEITTGDTEPAETVVEPNYAAWKAYLDAHRDPANDYRVPYYPNISEDFAAWRNNAEFTYSYNDRYAVSIWDYVYPVGMLIIMIVFMVLIFRGMRSGGNVINDFGKTKASVQSSLKVRFSDVAGAEEEKEELAEIVDFLKAPSKFTGVGAKIPKGVLLVGPPGTGKTLFAKAVAGEANVPFFSISGSDFVEMYVGVGASRVRDLFAQAKKNQPCIIFIDEIDAVGRHRGAGLGGGHDEREQTLNQLLVQMDGFEANEAIIVMAATNRADILDPALMRPGRFDRKITVNRPDVRGREEIFKVHARNKPIGRDVNFRVLARMTAGFTGADIANLLNESAILCARANRTTISMQDICEAIDKVTMGPAKRSRLVTEVDKRITAYHEGGHAIVAKVLEKESGMPVQEITIIPRGEAGGFTLMRPDNDDQFQSVTMLKAGIAIDMAGRAAEELVIKNITQGASMDIKQATKIARVMVTELGMSEEIGPVCYGGEQEVFLGMDYGSKHSYSESTAAKIDEEVRKLIEEGHKRALDILTENRSKLDVLVRVLFECETIYSEEFEMIMEGKSADEVVQTVNARTYRHYNSNGRGKSSEHKETTVIEQSISGDDISVTNENGAASDETNDDNGEE